MSGLKATEQDRLYLSGAIHRMGERTGSAAERILDDLDTLLAENAKLAEDYRAVLAGACTSAARAGARDATLRRLEAENARLRAVAEAAKALIAADHLSSAEEAAYRTLDAVLEDYRAVLAGACTSAARAGARDATLRRLEAENARLRAVAEALRAERRILQGPPLPPNTKRSATMRYFDAQQETDAALAALEAP